MKRFVVLLLLAATVPTGRAEEIFVPRKMSDQVEAIKSTELDLGEPVNIFDNNPKSLARTPSINPMEVLVSFKQPVEVQHMRLHIIQAQHTWTIGAADNLADLEAKAGSYRVLVGPRRTHEGQVEIHLDAPQTVRALRLDLERQGGDDYVHLWEWEFTRPGTLDGVLIERVTDRREADSSAGRREVEGTITDLEQTVVVLRATGEAQGVRMAVADKVEWAVRGDCVERFRGKPGEFLLTAPGKGAIVARLGAFERVIPVEVRPRKIANRKTDIEILFIERLPRLAYDDPNGGLPQVGDVVTWRAHLYNWGTEPVGVRYLWKVDGADYKPGATRVPPGPPGVAGTPLDLEWQWDGRDHDLTLRLSPTRALPDDIAGNNTLTIQMNAITVGLWVERGLWEYHHEHQHRMPFEGANSFAGWGQRMMRQWNNMFRDARFAEFPDGIRERVRLDRVVVVPDFALPLNGGLPSNNPDLSDKTVDMTWGCESIEVRGDSELPETHWWSPEKAAKAWADGLIEQEKMNPPFWCGLGYIHEMAHARYLVDAYGFNVHTGFGADIGQRMLQVTVDGEPVLGTYMPLDQDIQHWRKYAGQMGGNHWAWSVFDAMCWDRRRGLRAVGGNCNSPPNIGEFLQDIPERLVYRFVDPKGRPLANADIWVYQAQGTGTGWYTKKYVDKPAHKKRTDAEGRVEFDRTLWSMDGKIRHKFGHSNGVALVRVTHDGQHYFLFEEVTDANLAYNFGHKDEYELERVITLREGPPSPEAWDPDAKWQRPGTGFGRPPAEGARAPNTGKAASS